MQLTPVESSHIAAIGYLAAERVLLVRYQDGALYAFAPWSEVMWTALEASGSKGSLIAATKIKGVQIVKGGNAEDSQSTRGALPLAAVEPSAPLNAIDVDADACCRRSLSKSFAKFPGAAIMSCEECGQEFVPEMIGPNRYWRCKSNVAIVRPRR
jgi:hypothetical protein